VRLPFVSQQTGIRIDIAVRGRIGWTGRIRAILRIGSIVPLRPKPMEDKAGVSCALGGARMRMAKLRRPRKAEEIEVKARCSLARKVT